MLNCISCEILYLLNFIAPFIGAFELQSLFNFRESENAREAEELNWIEPQLTGFIIGKQHTGLRSLEQETKATVSIHERSIIVYGTKGQRDNVKRIVRNKIVCKLPTSFVLKS